MAVRTPYSVLMTLLGARAGGGIQAPAGGSLKVVLGSCEPDGPAFKENVLRVDLP
jgi:hypothetical protein